MKKTLSLVLTVFILLFSYIAFATENRYVDVDAVKAVEEQDIFSVKVVSKEIMYDVGKMSFTVNGDDVCALHIQNNSEHDIVRLTFMLIGYTEDQTIVNIYKEMFDHSEPGIQSLSWSGKKIESGSTAVCSIPCDASTFTGVRVIISEYMAEDGTCINNELAEAWRLAVEPDKATLDLDDIETIPSVSGSMNTAALKEIEQKDNSPVRIIDRKILLGRVDQDVRMQTNILIGDENDLCSISIKNMSGQKVTNLKIYYLAYDNNNNPVISGTRIMDFGSKYTYEVLSADNLEIPSGETAELYFPCNWEELAGIRMIISEYITEDGIVHNNSFAEEWAAAYTHTKTLD